MKLRFGFSLVEMLVVVSIIAILAAVGLATFTGSNKKAHDAKQKADVESIRSALELYKADNNGYPIQGSQITALAAYLPQYPTPPAGGAYTYDTPGCADPGPCSTYSVCATLETDGSTYCGIPGGIVITPFPPTPTPPTGIIPTSTPIPTPTPPTGIIPTSTPTPTPTPTPPTGIIPTSTPTPIPTPTPTSTPIPTPTPTPPTGIIPTPTPTSKAKGR